MRVAASQVQGKATAGVALLLVLWAGRVAAAPVPTSGPGLVVGDRVPRSARAALLAHEGAQADALAAARARYLRLAVAPSPELLATATARADAGWAAFLQVEFATARAELDLARTQLLPFAWHPTGRARYAEATLRRGAVALADGEPEASGYLRLALALAPTRALSEVEFSPDLLAAVTAAQQPSPATAALRVRALGASGSARVQIDANAPTSAPARTAVSPGRYLVVVTAPGAAPWVREVVVVDGAELDLIGEPVVSETWRVLDRGFAVDASDLDVAQLAVAISAWAARRELVFVTHDDAGAWIAQRCRAPVGEAVALGVRCTPVLHAVGDADVVPALRARLMQASLTSAPAIATWLAHAATPQPRARCGWCRQPIVWVALGGLSASAALWLALRDDAAAQPIISLDPDAFGRR